MPVAVPRSSALRRGGALAATLLSLAALPATAHADGWLRGPLLAGATTNPSGGIALGSDRTGVTTAAWQGGGLGSGGTVSFARIAPDGTASPAQTLGATSSGTVRPAVAVAPGGATVVAWTDDRGSAPHEVMLAVVATDGSTSPARTVAAIDDVDPQSVAVGVSDAGDAVATWLGENGGTDALFARRVAADGTLGPLVTVPVTPPSSPDDPLTPPRVAVSPAGDTWLSWIDGNPTLGAWTARLTPAGALDGAPVRLTAAGMASNTASLAASDNGAVVIWDEQGTSLLATRLAKSGPLVGAPVTISASVTPMSPADVAMTPGGVATIAWTDGPAAPGPDPLMTVRTQLRRLNPDGTLSPATAIPAAAGTMSAYPTLAAAPDGTVTTTWLEFGPTAESILLNANHTRADGTTTPTRQISGEFLLVLMMSGSSGFEAFGLSSAGSGHAVIAWPTFTGSTASIATRIYDGIAPRAEATAPATVALGSDANFAVTASDALGVASTWWEFGDDSGSRNATVRHRYADPGTYTVTLTVTDKAGNETTVTRQVTVVAPTPRATRVAARLKLTKVARKGAKVTVAGTLDRRAGGKVTIAYAQKIGRRSIAERVTAKIAKGRFSTTFALDGKLAQARGGKATVKVSYAGDADTNRASAKRTVANPKKTSRATRR